MTPDERQRARDRAADGVVLREAVRIGREGWPKPLDPQLVGRSASQKRQVHRERAKAALA